MQDDFIYRKTEVKDEEEACIVNADDEHQTLVISHRPSIKNLKKGNEPTVISLGEVSYYSNFFITVHPFIFYGYRIHHSYSECFKSVFRLHNETSNIWSHLLSFIGFFILAGVLFFGDKSMTKDGAIVFFYLFSSIVCFVSSTIYHIFNCHSEDACKCMFKVDLFGITFQLLCAMICGVHFMFHDFQQIRYLYFGIFAFLSFSAIIFTFVPVFVAEKFAIVRMIIFVSLFMAAFLCCIHWTVIAKIEEVEALSKYTLSAYGFVFTGFLFYLSKFPECLYQSRVIDYYFQSHTVWHLCVTGCAVSYYLLLYNYNLMLMSLPPKK